MKTREKRRTDDGEVRKALVEAAEKVADNLTGKRDPEKTQLSRLISVAGQASCGSEIANYLRYQAARKKWPMKETDGLIDRMEKLVGNQKIPTDEETLAWRYFAGYLARARLYREKSEENRR